MALLVLASAQTVAKGVNLLAVSKGKMSFEKAEDYCRQKGARIPEKEELDQMVVKNKSGEFIWTYSKMFQVGPEARVVYRLAKESVFGPPLGQEYRVRCIK